MGPDVADLIGAQDGDLTIVGEVVVEQAGRPRRLAHRCGDGNRLAGFLRHDSQKQASVSVARKRSMRSGFSLISSRTIHFPVGVMQAR